ncbi:MAG: histidinol dehydrogenase [Phycisphaerae bacterium]
MIRRIDYRTDAGRRALDALRAALDAEQGIVSGGEGAGEVETAVRRLLDDVRARGDAAVCEATARFDGVDLTPDALRVPAEVIEAAYDAADPAFVATVTRIRESVRAFQRQILARPPEVLERDGRRLRLLYRPLARVGVYVPGGRAFYPSSVLMTAVPALAAGVPEVAVACPPSAVGDVHAAVLAVCRVAGVEEVYRMGGVQAIAALAYGTQAVPAVEKIVGPGNAYVQAAKRLVFGRVDIEGLAGPSEVVVLADGSADAALVAADLLSQAEHDPGSAILVTTDEALAGAVADELARQVAALARAEATREALEKYSALVVTGDLDEAVRVTNAIAPEHLEIQTADPEAVLRDVRCAGAVFLGRHTPVAVGDYVAGPSHTLPTGGTARWASGLTANDFLRSMSVVEYDAAALAADAPDIERMAETEGLTAHAESVRKRLEC